MQLPDVLFQVFVNALLLLDPLRGKAVLLQQAIADPVGLVLAELAAASSPRAQATKFFTFFMLHTRKHTRLAGPGMGYQSPASSSTASLGLFKLFNQLRLSLPDCQTLHWR